MKQLFVMSLLLGFSLSSFAGYHGNFVLNCTSKSLRTHMYMQLNDYDFIDEVLYPQVIVLSVMGSMRIFDEKQNYGFGFKTVNKDGLLEIYSTDGKKSHVFKVDFRKKSSAKVVIEKAVNPRTQKVLSGLTLECKKRHDL